MADLGKITPTKPAWSRTGEVVVPDENHPHPQRHPEKDKEKEEEKNRESGETSEQHKRPSDPDDEHEIDLFV